MDLATSGIEESQLNASPVKILQSIFGFETFRPLQEKIIQSLLQGQDNFVLMPTGGGKSLCYQIPAIMRRGVGIIVSPLISLMQDQVAALQANGVSAAFYNSALGSGESREVLRALHHNELDLFYIAPERLLTESFIARLQNLEIALFAIDEVHCVSQWGHDFRPEYVKLGSLRRYFPNVPMIALTATADKQTRSDILKILHLENAHVHVGSFNRPNIRYNIIEKHKPLQQLQLFLQQHANQAGIVYCTTRKTVDEIAAKLQHLGFKAKPYHAGLSTKVREKTQTAFQHDDIDIIVATIAFGMGIDKPNVRFVVHYDIPKNVEGYYQETGRAGRDGLLSEALLFYGLGDITKVRALIEMSNNELQKRIETHKLNAMAALAEAQTCRRKVLLNYFGEELVDDCGNCDICLNPPETYDGTVDAQKALSCIYRVQQRFGIGHIIEVLRGADTQKIKNLGHHKLSTYGIGKHLNQEEWGSVIRQLIHLGYLEQDIAHYSVLKLTEKCKPLLKGECKIELAKPRIKITSEKKVKRASKKIDLEYDEGLFQHLRKLRKRLADEMDVAPFIIFSDASLVEMAAFKPSTKDAFLDINGVGERKMEVYGEAFIEAIVGYAAGKY